MQNKADTILRAVNNSFHDCNILTAPTHERYQYNLKEIPCNFFMVQSDNFVQWDKNKEVPKNHFFLPKLDNPFTPNHRFDITLSQNKFGQFQKLKPLADQMNTPLISLEHTWPHPDWTDKYIGYMKNMSGDFNVFISQESCKAWGYDLYDDSVRVIYHGVDTDWFRPNFSKKKDGKVLTVVNDYINRSWAVGFDVYQSLALGELSNPVGDTPGFSKPLNGPNLVDAYQKASVFLNTSTHSPIPMSLLEAAACGCPIVTTATCAIPEIIKDGYNGYCSNEIGYLRRCIDFLLANPQKAEQMGKNARLTIEQDFSLEEHLSNWEALIDEAFGSIHYDN